MRRVGEEFPRRLGHALDFEREDLQFVHRLGDAVGNHAQVFAAGQHLGRREEHGEFAQGRLLPEPVVAAVKEVVVKPVESVAPLRVEGAVHIGRLGRDAGMEKTFAARVLDEQHVVEQRHQPFAQAASARIVAGKALGDLALRRIGGQQPALLHAGRAHFVGQLAEQFAEHPVVGRGNGEASPGRIEAHAAQFVGGVGQGGIEIAQQAVNGMYGNLPDAEEAEDMVDAESVEIFGHLRHAGLPPRIAVLRHVLPVVGREAPVLARCGKGVGRCSGLRIHVEKPRMNPCVGARPADADRQVALEDDAPAAGVGADLGQLRVQVVLHEAVKRDFAAVAAAVGFDGLFVVAGVIAPAGEIGGAEFVAQRAEGGIGDEPVSIGGDEVLVVAACRSAGSVAFERPAEQPQFVPVDPFVVYFGECVQFVAQGAVLVVLHDARGRQPDELRVQGEGRIGVVGVGVFPCTGHGGIVDRQYLDDALPGGGRPVDEPFQVVELTDAEILFRTEREDRDRRPGALPSAFGEPRVRRGVEGVFAGAGQFAPGAVGTLLPQDGGEGLAVGDQEFVFEPVCGM